jgi:hypothetical protein
MIDDTEAICIHRARSCGRLTPGSTYTIIATDEEAEQIRVRDDSGRPRWFPWARFDIGGRSAPRVLHWRSKEKVDEIDAPNACSVTVEVTLTDGATVEFWMVTPTELGMLDALIYGDPGVVIMPEITEAAIGDTVRFLMDAGLLLDCMG